MKLLWVTSFTLLISLCISKDNADPPKKQVLDVKKGDNSEKFFMPVKYHRITTHTKLVLATSTVFPTCVSGSVAQVELCGRRRKRQTYIRDLLADFKQDSKDTLSSSKISEPRTNDARIFKVTVWSTTTSSTSVTILFTNTASTVSFQLVCHQGGLSLPPAC